MGVGKENGSQIVGDIKTHKNQKTGSHLVESKSWKKLYESMIWNEEFCVESGK